MVRALLPADCGAHAVIIATRSAPKAHVVPGSPGDNARRGVRIVLAHSTAAAPTEQVAAIVIIIGLTDYENEREARVLARYLSKVLEVIGVAALEDVRRAANVSVHT